MVAHAEVNVAITNWIPNYQYIAAGSTNVGTTGIATNTAYICIPVTNMPSLTTNQADEAAGDFRALVYGVNEYFLILYQEAPSSNRSAKLVMTESVEANSRTNMTVAINIQTKLSGTGVTIESE